MRDIILIIENDLDDILLLTDALEIIKPEYDIVFVNNIDQFKKHVTETKKLPRLIILDLYLPKDTGVDILDYIKKHETYSRLPVIIYSNMVENFIRTGSKHYFISKPQSFDHIVKSLNIISDLLN